MDDFKKACEVGGGGWKCPCCGPKRKHRPAARKAARSRLARKWKKEAEKEIEAVQE